MSGRVPTTVHVDRDLWVAVRKAGVELKVSASDLVNVGLRVVVEALMDPEGVDCPRVVELLRVLRSKQRVPHIIDGS